MPNIALKLALKFKMLKMCKSLEMISYDVNKIVFPKSQNTWHMAKNKL
jgi:hypothetical protein